MAFGYKTIKDQLVAILQTVSSLKVVYGKEEKAIKQFPAACVSAKEHSAQLHDTVSNLKQYQHYVRLYFRTDEQNDPDYEDVLESVADDVISVLEHNLTLNGVVDWALPTTGTWRNVAKESPVRMLELVITSKARVVR